MATATIDDQLTSYLSDAHSIEEQALAQLRRAPGVAGESQLASILAEHLHETEEHERLVRARMEARGASPSALKDAVMKTGGVGFVLFAQSQPDTPGKLASHSLSYEALELASYELLRRVAERAGDAETAETARRIGAQERQMAERIEATLDRTTSAALADLDRDDLVKQLVKYLTDAHALEAQVTKVYERAAKLAGDPELARLHGEQVEQSRAHAAELERLLDAHDAQPSKAKDAAMAAGGLNWSAFFQLQPDTEGKLVAFAFALQYLQIGGYEQLARVADRAGDGKTADAARHILIQERAESERLAAAFDRAAEAALRRS